MKDEQEKGRSGEDLAVAELFWVAWHLFDEALQSRGNLKREKGEKRGMMEEPAGEMQK